MEHYDCMADGTMHMMWLCPMLWVLLLCVAVVCFAIWGTRSFLNNRTGKAHALDRLDLRFASGDISKEQYEDMKKVLKA